jgi:hypothetical protein
MVTSRDQAGIEVAEHLLRAADRIGTHCRERKGDIEDAQRGVHRKRPIAVGAWRRTGGVRRPPS